MKARVIVFKDGRRIEKRINDHTKAIPVVRELRRKGLRVALVLSHVVDKRRYPSGDIEEERFAGKWWCPYCGAWRWFKVPKFKENGVTVDLTDTQFYLNSCFRQGLRVCAWCYVSENEWSVKNANGTWAEQPKRRRRRRRRR